MSKKNMGLFQILITFALVFSAFLSRHSVLIFAASIFFISASVSYIICNLGFGRAVLMSGCAVLFCFVTSFVNKTLVLSDVLDFAVLFLPGFVLGTCFKAKLSFKDTFVFVMAAYFLILILVFAISKFVFNLDITAQLREGFLNNFDDNLNMIKTLSPKAFEQIEANEHQIFNTLYVLIPGLVPFVSALIFTFVFLVEYAVSKLVCTGYLVRTSSFMDGFDSFRPGIVTNIVMLLMLATVMFESSQSIVMICINVALIILILYFITTLSFIDNKLKHRGFYPGKRFALIAAIVTAAIISSLIIPIVNFIYVFMFFGFLDSLFDFRKLNAKKVK